MRKQEDDYTNNDMKGTDMSNGVGDGSPTNCFGEYFVKSESFAHLLLLRDQVSRSFLRLRVLYK